MNHQMLIFINLARSGVVRHQDFGFPAFLNGCSRLVRRIAVTISCLCWRRRTRLRETAILLLSFCGRLLELNWVSAAEGRRWRASKKGKRRLLCFLTVLLVLPEANGLFTSLTITINFSGVTFVPLIILSWIWLNVFLPVCVKNCTSWLMIGWQDY